MKRFCALILALTLLLCETVYASVTPEADKTTLEAGQTVYVTVKLDAPIEGVRGLSYDLYYDSDLFDYTPASNKAGDAISGAQASAAAKTDASGKNYVLIAYLDMTAAGQTVNAGTLYTVAFTAKTDISQETAGAFELKQEKALDASREAITTASAEVSADNASISVTVAPKTPKVTGVSLDQTALTLKVGSEETLAATVTADEGVDATVTWTVADETIASVVDGKITGLKMGRTTVTATAGDVSASCEITVNNVSAADKYSVEMDPELTQHVKVGDTVAVNVKVTDETRTTYNAVDLEISYDAAVLKYAGETTITNGTIEDDGKGTLTLVRYGSDLKTGDVLTTLLFTVLQAQDTQVALASAKVDEAAKADTQDAPEATIINSALIQTAGFSVTLPDEFEGETEIRPGQDYTFSAKDADKYDYTSVKATIGGQDVAVTDNGDGTYTIKAQDLTGDVTITGERSGKEYDVYVTGPDTTGADKAQYGTDYNFTIDKQSGYNYTVSVSVPYTDNGDGTYTIAGSDITQAITVRVTRTKASTEPTGTTTITITGAASDEVAGGLEQTVPTGQDFTLTLNKDAAYDYVVKLDGTAIEPNEDGTYTIPGSKITGAALEISVEKTLVTPTVEVVEYLKMKEVQDETSGETSGQTMWLVLVSGKPVDGSVYTYDGKAMYKTEGVYGDAYYYLMISGKAKDEVLKDATALISQKEGTAAAISYEGDVNGTGLVDINDAQLVYNMYNAQYAAFTDRVAVENFLRADMNKSKNVDVTDATSIVDKILQ